MLFWIILIIGVICGIWYGIYWADIGGGFIICLAGLGLALVIALAGSTLVSDICETEVAETETIELVEVSEVYPVEDNIYGISYIYNNNQKYLFLMDSDIGKGVVGISFHPNQCYLNYDDSATAMVKIYHYDTVNPVLRWLFWNTCDSEYIITIPHGGLITGPSTINE